jgi:hypothetical protein
MRSHHRIPTSRTSHPSRILLAITLFVALWSPPAIPCGNVNCSGGVDLSDVSAAVSYLTGGGYVFCNYPQSDMDNHYLFTWVDMAMIIDVTGHPYAGVCPPALDRLDPPLSVNDYLYYDKTLLPANATKLTVQLGLKVSDSIDMAVLPIQFLIDGATPAVDSVKVFAPFAKIGNVLPLGTIEIALWPGGQRVPSATYPSTDNPVATVFLSIAATGVDRSLAVNFKAVGPVQDTFLVTTPMVVAPWPSRNSKTPTVRQSCCFGTTGNVNTIGPVDLADLSLLVSFLTGGTSSLPCPEEANTNGQGAVDLSDLSLLVAVLTGGPETFTSCR